MKGVEQLKVLYLVKSYDQIEYLNIRTVVLKPGVATHLCVADFLQGVTKTS